MSPCFQSYLLLAFAGALAPPTRALAASQSTGPSDTAFVLARAGVVPENIVYDAPRNRFRAASTCAASNVGSRSRSRSAAGRED
jgi:hypothetical protein